MKKFTLLFLFFSLAVSAQVFPELDPTLLKPGMKVKTNDDVTWSFEHFYSDSLAYKKYKPGPDRYTPAKELSGRTFEVIDVKADGNDIPVEYYILTLKDVANQEILRYNNPVRQNDTAELLMIDTIELPSDYFCGYVRSGTELTSISLTGILRFDKFMEGNKIKYALILYTGTIKKNSGQGTITLNLKNGKKIVKPKSFATARSSNSIGEVAYSTQITLTPEDLKLLKESEMISFDFFGLYEKKLDQQESGIIKGSIDCFMKR
jgi:hypothetical protein